MAINDRISGRQIAAARVLKGISQEELAKMASISAPTLRRMEASDGPATGLENNVKAVRAALESADVIFVDENGNGPGVRLLKPKDAEPYVAAPNDIHLVARRTGLSKVAGMVKTRLDGFSLKFRETVVGVDLVAGDKDREHVMGAIKVGARGEVEFNPPYRFERDRRDGRLTSPELFYWAICVAFDWRPVRAPAKTEPKKAGARQTVDEVLGLLAKVRRSTENE
jgi:transcriptional regulator with XRE-family HTH domain